MLTRARDCQSAGTGRGVCAGADRINRGTTKFHRLAENLAVVDLELTAQDLSYISAELFKGTVKGERLPEAALKMTGR